MAIDDFKLSEELYCSGTTTLNASSGSFDDGSGANNYDNNSNCQWLIQPAASSITLSFSAFDLESNDQVTIYDGDNTSAPILGTFYRKFSSPQPDQYRWEYVGSFYF